jgi:hypothetical protein
MDCTTCSGAGGWDRSKDCEVYDDWWGCPDCDGTGTERIAREDMNKREQLIEDIGQLTEELRYMRRKVEIYETDLMDAIDALESYDSGDSESTMHTRS